MVVALLALVVAMTGTAIAATLVSGDSLIKKGSLSGNRLKKHTITGTQVKLSKLGKVPSATKADSATNANHATSATNATTALSATSAGSATNATHANAADNLTPLPSGQSESGAFSAGSANAPSGGWLGVGITYARPLATPIPDGHIIDLGTTTDPTHCPGVGHAAPGYLCLYDQNLYFQVHDGYGYSDDAGYFSSPSPGVILYFPVSGTATSAYVGGEYTVTAA
jgi:hypothetical protein